MKWICLQMCKTLLKPLPNETRINNVFVKLFTAKLINWNFHSTEIVSRWRDPQLQVSENYSDFVNDFEILHLLYLSCLKADI